MLSAGNFQILLSLHCYIIGEAQSASNSAAGDTKYIRLCEGDVWRITLKRPIGEIYVWYVGCGLRQGSSSADYKTLSQLTMTL